MRTSALVIGFAAALGLAGCSGGATLNNFKSGQSSPDEFAILPTRSLAMPPDLAVLPAPTPGGANITDPNPLGDAVAALGGSPERLANRGVGAPDQALVAHAGRGGSDPQIRARLAEADADWRARNGRRPLERIAGTPVYQRAYAPMALDAATEQLRWQRAGAITSTAPAPAAE
ncbi:DUF3035 domain-containing protein [Paracoccus liaowanqingii]|uniref:DUF3035 domain-containing protein n=1 Tax=Paracoccus liaowanqingii TaxID=2560053 RepID=A0A4V1BIF7_9RHOB|nr:DUF3035 domain-containing protein [Paracoccus liaowanqingii]QBX33334.1 DUF3035 domain-containing protein [Paracoccus liaowanqingii]